MNILLLTGAIDISPYTLPSTSLTNTWDRFSQYVQSIQYAIDNYTAVTHIIFCENTNFRYDYSNIAEHARSKNIIFEILSFKGDYNEIQKKGKGYGEGEIIQYAMSHSKYLSESESFYKLTGRLIIKNFDSIVNHTEYKNAFSFYPNTIYDREKSHIDTAFFKTGTNFYTSRIANAFLSVDEAEHLYLEHLFLERLEGLRIRSFNRLPKISGLSGTSGKSYDLSLRDTILEYIYYRIGVHNLSRAFIESSLVRLLTVFLRTWRWRKKN